MQLSHQRARAMRQTPALGKGSVLDGLERYKHDAYDVLTTYWSTWPAVHFVSFTLLPPEVRSLVTARTS